MSNSITPPRRTSDASTMKLSDTEIAKRLGQYLRTDLELEQELVKNMSSYRTALETLAQTSENLAHTVGKLAMHTMTSQSFIREYRTEHGDEPDARWDNKQKQLSAALQQIIKFHKMLSNQQLVVANVSVYDFDRPLQLNMDSFKITVAVRHTRRGATDFDRRGKRNMNAT